MTLNGLDRLDMKSSLLRCPARPWWPAGSRVVTVLSDPRGRTPLPRRTPRVAACSRTGLPEGGQAAERAEAHRLDGGRGNDDHRALLAQPLVDHVHGAQVPGDRVVAVVVGGAGELLGDPGLGGAEDDAALPFALGLGLARHGVCEHVGDDDVADLAGVRQLSWPPASRSHAS
jgi:hypothetical protein